MNLNFINKMLEQNPALNQLLQLKTMLDKLPQSKQEELVTEFVNSLNIGFFKYLYLESFL